MIWPTTSSRISGVTASCGENPPVWKTIRPCATAFMPSVKIIDGARR